MNPVNAIQLLMLVYKVTTGLVSLLQSKDLDSSKASETLAMITGRIGSDLEQIMKDNSVDYKDISNIVKLIRDLSGLLGFDFKKAKSEIIGSSKEDIKAIVAAFKQEFNLEDDIKETRIEMIIEDIMIILSASKDLAYQFAQLK
jgi:hypothetical protein